MRRAFVMGSNGSPEVGYLNYARKNATDLKAVQEEPSCGFQVTMPELAGLETCAQAQISA
jgi:hypothetical protein